LLEEAGVAVLPGEDFGRPAEELTLRLAYVNFDGARALAAAMHAENSRPDPAFPETYCDQVLAGIDKLCEWVAG
jgi:aspartate aminotransferase